MEVYLFSVLPKIQFTSKRVLKDVCVCEKHLEHSCHPFENKGTQCYKPVQARVLPCYLWKTRSVWIKQMMPRQTTKKKKKRRRSHDSFPKP